MFQRLSSFFQQCKRVWYVLRKPNKQEFGNVAKISAIGILILGLLGFVISAVINFIK